MSACVGALILGTPVAASADSFEADRKVAVTQSHGTQRSAAKLTFTSASISGGYQLSILNNESATVSGMSGSGADFTQNDGWDQEAQQWTGGNELKFGFDGYEFSIGNLEFKSGTATGDVSGSAEVLPNGHMSLAGDADQGVQPSKVVVNGDSVTITATDGYGSDWVLNFTLA